MLPPNSNRAPNKTILFLLDRKFVSACRNEKFAFPREKLFSLPGISHKWKKRFYSIQKNIFYQEQWRLFVKVGFRIIIIMVTTSKKNTILAKIFVTDSISGKISLPNHFFKDWGSLFPTINVVAMKSLIKLHL